MLHEQSLETVHVKAKIANNNRIIHSYLLTIKSRLTAKPTYRPETTRPLARGIEKIGITEEGVLSDQKPNQGKVVSV